MFICQDRYIALKEGTLVYFKSEIETDFGCRGAISIDKATVKQHEVDDLRFDVSVSDCVWYLRAASIEDRQRWIEGIEGHKRYAQELSLNGPHSGGLNDLTRVKRLIKEPRGQWGRVIQVESSGCIS